MTEAGSELNTRTENGLAIRDEELREISSIDDALEVLRQAGVPIRTAADELGDGFILADDAMKDSLVGTPFLIMAATESEGDYSDSFVTLRIITRDGRKIIVNDGSTGIRAQVLAEAEAGKSVAGLLIEGGLRKSDYRYCENCGTVNKSRAVKCKACEAERLTPAATYYLSTN